MHCAKAFMRSKLWQPEKWPDIERLPSIRGMLFDHAKPEGMTLADFERRLDSATRRRLLLDGGCQTHPPSPSLRVPAEPGRSATAGSQAPRFASRWSRGSASARPRPTRASLRCRAVRECCAPRPAAARTAAGPLHEYRVPRPPPPRPGVAASTMPISLASRAPRLRTVRTCRRPAVP